MQIESQKCRKCDTFCGSTHIYPNIARKLKCSIQRLNNSRSVSLLKKYLTDQIYHDLKRSKTALGTTLLDCIQSGIENLDSSLGIYALDAECYKTFRPLFGPIIQDFHHMQPDFVHPPENWGNVNEIKDLPTLITKITISCRRALANYAFPAKMKRQQFIDFTNKMASQFKTIKAPADLKGTFLPYENIQGGVLEQLQQANVMFGPDSRFLEANENYNYWPDGRALFMNKPKKFFIWFNEEDHLKFISTNKGPLLNETYKTLSTCVVALSKLFKFVRDEKFGYLTVNPANLGTTMRFEIVAKCPSLLTTRPLLDRILEKYNLDAEIPPLPSDLPIPPDASVIFSNKVLLGITEFDIAQNIQNAMEELAVTEKAEEKRLKQLAKKKKK